MLKKLLYFMEVEQTKVHSKKIFIFVYINIYINLYIYLILIYIIALYVIDVVSLKHSSSIDFCILFCFGANAHGLTTHQVGKYLEYVY